MTIINWLMYAAAGLLSGPADSCKQCIVLAEQSEHRIAIADVTTQQLVWEWQPARSNIAPAHVQWFHHPSEAKVVYGGRYLLTCASGGGVALVRMVDRQAVFYAYAGGNTHSVELLPDGNIVAASSTGNYLTLFSVDTLHANAAVQGTQVPVTFGHNVVWDRRRQLLWTAAGSELIAFRYNFNKEQPGLLQDTAIVLPGKDAHDLFPVYGADALWLTNTTHVYRFDVEDKQLTPVNTTYQQHIKSITNGPAGYPAIIIQPKTSWWTDEVMDLKGRRIFQGQGLRIYKARWLVQNEFSYPPVIKEKMQHE